MRAAGKKIYLNTTYVFHNYIEKVLKNKVMGDNDPEKERQKK